MIATVRVKFDDGSIKPVEVEFKEHGTVDCTPMDRLLKKGLDCKWVNKLFGVTVADSIPVCAMLKGVNYEANATIDPGYDYFQVEQWACLL